MTDSELQSAITAIADNSPNTASEIRAIFNELYLRTPKSNTIIIKDVTNLYIADNFDGTGLGINLEVGYAIVNGANLTRNWAGRIPLAYGTGYTTMGTTGGSATHTLTVDELPSHSHGIEAGVNTSGGAGANSVSNVTNNATDMTTNAIGGGQAHNNMQPYIVTLILMKL